MTTFNSETFNFTIRIGQTVLTGIYYGACQYISSVECPARYVNLYAFHIKVQLDVLYSRINLPSGVDMVENFQQVFPRAKAFQGGIALLAGIDGVLQYILDKNHPGSKFFLASGLILLSIWPYTIAVIMPINNQLMEGDKPKSNGDNWIKDMMSSWDKVHWVRTIGGGLAFGLALKGLLSK